MAITTVSSHVVSVNAIQGTLIADNAITAVHIATNAVSGTLIADNAVTAVHIAQNSITVTQLADDCVESDKIADGVITTNHLNKAMISSQTEVTPVAGDFVLLGDTSDSNNLKKAPLTLLLNSNVDLSSKANLASPSFTGTVTITGASSAYNTLQLTSNSTGHGTIINLGDTSDADYGSITQFASSAGEGGRMRFIAGTTETMNLRGGKVGIGETSPETSLHIKNAGNSFLTLERSGTTGGTGKFGINMEGGSSQQTTMGYDDGGKLVIGRSSDPATMAGFNNDFVLDSSGSLLVGKTEDGTSNPGHVFFGAGAAYHIRDGGFTNYFNRKSSDGEILRFAKDGTVVGNIGASVGDLTIYSSASGHCGLRFTSGGLAPVDNTGSLSADSIDIGQSSWKFRNLYLSSGAYVYEVQTQTLGLGSSVAGASVGTTYSEPRGVFWHNGSGMTDYAIYRTPGAWSGNYQQLKMDWDTGIIIDGGTAYGKSGVHIHGNISMGDSTYSNFTSPNYPVHICADNYSLMIESGTGYSHFGSNNSSYFHIVGNRTYYFGQRCEASGGFHTYSDENLKKEITAIPSALNKVAQMNGVTFKWKDAAKRGGGDSGKQFGVTAQNMLTVDSELPTLNKDPLYNIEDGVTANDEYYTMDYSRITPFLIEAVKELKTKLEAAEARIATLEG